MPIRINNPETEDTAVLVRTLREDVAPGEPASLMGEFKLRPGETAAVALPFGAVIAITRATLNDQAA